jgi:hypothetical protein
VRARHRRFKTRGIQHSGRALDEDLRGLAPQEETAGEEIETAGEEIEIVGTSEIPPGTPAIRALRPGGLSKVLSSVFALDGVVASFVADKAEAAMGMCPAPIDFELLRVVGQGAFGKVRASCVATTPSRNRGSSELHATCNDTSSLSSLSSSPEAALPSPFLLL